MNKYIMMIVLIGSMATLGHAEELQKEYFAATRPGAWAQYTLKAADGSTFLSSSQRNMDDNGHVVIEESTKGLSGAGVGMESKNTYVMQKDFNLAHDWLSYGKFTEKMKMQAGGVVYPVDATTFAAIKKSSKDFRGALTFEGREKVDGYACDRYAYSLAIAGPAPSKEEGKLWLDSTVPFGIVRQTAKSYAPDGSVASSYELQLQETGHVQVEAPAAPVTPALPAVVSLLDGYNAGRIGLEVSVEQGSNGKRLQLVFINKTDTQLTVKLKAGALDIPASTPIEALKIVVNKTVDVDVPAGTTSTVIIVDQQPGRGAFDGKFELSVYEGTKLFSGSVTKGTVK